MSEKTELVPNRFLLQERLTHHWSQRELATSIGTTFVNISRWERGITHPGAYFRHKLCEIFDKSAEELGLVQEKESKSDEFIQSVFTQQTQLTFLPTATAFLWNIPHRRNPLFTGREDILLSLHTLLHSGKTVTLTQVQAISGLGGIGKTQTAVEYVYQYYDDYSAIFWVRAETRALIIADFVAIAAHLNLSEKDEQDQTRIMEATKRWLNTSTNWFLVFDNVEDFTMLHDFLPREGNGSILITTRSQSTGVLARCIALEQMQPEEGAYFLLRRAKIIEYGVPQDSIPEEIYNEAKAIAHVLDGLPLALDQAGAYIEETGCSLMEYKNRYHARQITLLSRRGTTSIRSPRFCQLDHLSLFQTGSTVQYCNRPTSSALCLFRRRCHSRRDVCGKWIRQWFPSSISCF